MVAHKFYGKSCLDERSISHSARARFGFLLSHGVAEQKNVHVFGKELHHNGFSLAVGEEMVPSAGADHDCAARRELQLWRVVNYVRGYRCTAVIG